ncbi:MAG: site-specific integrase [Cellvibrionaceae bacterium]|nr:site-specific integrase [Cellvibrionaceae bacterium]
MASITQTPDGSYRVKIRKRGYEPISRNFTRKGEAQRWAREVETEMDKGIFVSTIEAETTLVSDIMNRYQEEVASTKKSAYDIGRRLKLLRPYFGHLTLAAVTPSIIKIYKEERLSIRMPETVRKELGVLNRVLDFAIKDCEIYMPRGNPMTNVRLPPKSKGRDRRLNHGEEQKLVEALSEYGGFILPFFLFALETGMRRGEIVKLDWKDINLQSRVATSRDTKNGEDRAIPLSTQAISILQTIPRHISGRVFPIRGDSATQAFRRCRERAGIEDFRLHDLRHEATSRFFELGLSIMEVSSITGHKDLAMLKRYTHLRPQDLAKKLG